MTTQATVSMYDVVVIGAGPVGLACAIAGQHQGLRTLTVDKGTLVNSLVGYPTGMEFFSTPDLLEIGGHPFPTQRYKPIREEALDYYRRVARSENLEVRLYEDVQRVEGTDDAFTVVTDKGRYASRKVIVATGFFDTPNRLHIPGENLPKVSHYYKEPYGYTGCDLAVIGAKNSAAKAALASYRHGARVSLIVRGPELSSSIKYWLRPDLANRIKEGSITAYFNTTVSEITPTALHLNTPDGPRSIPNDFVLAMTGYRPDYPFLERLGVARGSDAAQTPVYDEETFETNREGIYLAGTVCGGLRTSRWFIENGRFHAQVIAKHIAEPKAGVV